MTQLRDPGLDISYRKATSDVGASNAKLEGLNSLATILDEVGKGSLDQDDGVILSQLNDLRDLISQAITNGTDTYDTLIRSSAQSLATLFNSYADKLSELEGTYEKKLDQQMEEVNNILTKIRDLNVSIRDSDIRGDDTRSRVDERNRLLDELSEYVKIDVTYSMEDVGADTLIEKLTVTLATGDKNPLVDGEYSTQFSLDPQNSSNYSMVLGPLTNDRGQKQSEDDNGVTLGDNDLYGSSSLSGNCSPRRASFPARPTWTMTPMPPPSGVSPITGRRWTPWPGSLPRK